LRPAGQQEVLDGRIDRAVVRAGSHGRECEEPGGAAKARDHQHRDVFEVIDLPLDGSDHPPIFSLPRVLRRPSHPYTDQACRYSRARRAFTSGSRTTIHSQFWALLPVGAFRASSMQRRRIASSTGSGFSRRMARWVSMASESGMSKPTAPMLTTD